MYSGMLNKLRAKMSPELFLMTGKCARILRKELKFSQSEFWGRIKVTQSGGSVYETGRELPAQVQVLLHLAYAPITQAQAMLSHLRINEKL